MKEEEPDELTPRERGYRLGLRVGRAFRFLGLGLAIDPAIRAVLRFRDRRLRASFAGTYPDKRVVAFLLLSERHQWEHFLGENGSFSSFSHRIAVADWREGFWLREDETWEEHAETFRGLVAKRWQLSNLRRDLPFGLVLTALGTFHAFRFNESYRSRLRDEGPLRHQEQSFIELLVAAHRDKAA